MDDSQSRSVRFTVRPSATVKGVFQVPGDKSISHRAVMFGALATGKTTVSGFLESEDVLATARIFSMMGVDIQRPAPKTVTIQGVGKYGLKAPDGILDCGNSGTTMRLLSGILAGQRFETTLVGDCSLMKRPMRRVAEPLSRLGASIATADNGCPPLVIRPVSRLVGTDFHLTVPSAQLKSAILLAGLFSEGVTQVTQTQVTRDHTERMLQAFSCPVDRVNHAVSVSGNSTLTATDITVPGDISSAAFLMVAATIAKDAEVLLTDVGVNATRTGVIDILNAMGADITLENHRTVGGEPIANIRVRSSELTAITIPEYSIPLAIDEFPAIFIAAACAKGDTVLRNASELRVKESDRISVMAEGLRTLGIDVETYDDGMRIMGQAQWGGGEIQSHHDHRIAMAFTIASLRATAPIVIHGAESVATSFPGFTELMQSAGIDIEEQVTI